MWFAGAVERNHQVKTVAQKVLVLETWSREDNDAVQHALRYRDATRTASGGLMRHTVKQLPTES